jgi:hypothetical protein
MRLNECMFFTAHSLRSLEAQRTRRRIIFPLPLRGRQWKSPQQLTLRKRQKPLIFWLRDANTGILLPEGLSRFAFRRLSEKQKKTKAQRPLCLERSPAEAGQAGGEYKLKYLNSKVGFSCLKTIDAHSRYGHLPGRPFQRRPCSGGHGIGMWWGDPGDKTGGKRPGGCRECPGRGLK